MRPEDVPDELVKKVLETRLPSGGLPPLNEPQVRTILAAVLPEVAQQVRNLGHAMREADGWDEEWSTREVRDALNIAADGIDGRAT